MGRCAVLLRILTNSISFRAFERKKASNYSNKTKRIDDSPWHSTPKLPGRLDKPQTGMLFSNSSARGGDSGQLQQEQYDLHQSALWELSRLRRQSRRALLQRVEVEQQNHRLHPQQQGKQVVAGDLRVEQGQEKPSFSLSSSGPSSTSTSRSWHGTTALPSATVLRELSWLRRKSRRALLLQLVVEDDVVGRHIDVEESMDEPRQQEMTNVELDGVGDFPASILPVDQGFGIDRAKALAGMRGHLLGRSTIVRPEVRTRHG
jgi:hypothetical protein